jgi:hypothetical protein
MDLGPFVQAQDMARRRLLAVILPVVLVACGGRASESGPEPVPADVADASGTFVPEAATGLVPDVLVEAPSQAEPKMGFAVRTCGGDDAPSVIVRVAAKGTAPLTCALPRPAGTFDEIWPWRPLAVGPVPFTIPDTGAAASCDEDGCTDAVSATVTITNLSPPGTLPTPTATGSYTLQLPDGTTRSGAFVVVLCDNPSGPCG